MRALITALVAIAAGASAAHATNYALVQTLPLPVGEGNAGFAVDASTHDVYATSIFGGLHGSLPSTALYAFHGTTRSERLLSPAGALAIDPSDHRVYSAASPYPANSTTVSTLAGDAVQSQVTVNGVSAGLAVDPSTHTLFVALADRGVADSGRIVAIRDGIVRSTVVLDRAPGGLAYDAGSRLLVTSDIRHASVSSYRDGALVWRVAVPDTPSSIAVDPSTHTIYVAAQYSDAVTSIRDGAVVARLSVPGPTGMAVDPGTHRVYFNANGGMRAWNADGSLDIIDPGLAQGSPIVDPSTHRLYTASRSNAAIGEPAGIAVLEPTDAPTVERIGSSTALAGARDGVFYALFSQPMDREATAAAVSVVQSSGGTARGQVHWLSDTALVFVPTGRLAASATATMTVGVAARDQEGRGLAAPRSAQLFTDAPVVVAHSPDPSPTAPCTYPDTPVYLVFDEPMERASVERAFRLTRGGTGVPGGFAWFGDQVMGFIPDAPLSIPAADDPFDTGFKAALAATAAPLRGGSVGREQAYLFQVVAPPSIASESPADGATGISRTAPPIKVTFGQAMRQDGIENAFTVKRTTTGVSVPGTITWQSDRSLTFKPVNFLGQNTHYTVTVSPTAFDARGCQLPATTSWTFQTAP